MATNSGERASAARSISCHQRPAASRQRMRASTLRVSTHQRVIFTDRLSGVRQAARQMVGAINREFLVPEIEQLLPRRVHAWAPPIVHALERVFLGDQIAGELAIPDTRLTFAIRGVGPVLGAINRVLDRTPGMLRLRTDRGERYRIRQDARLRARYAVRHDLVDAACARRVAVRGDPCGSRWWLHANDARSG